MTRRHCLLHLAHFDGDHSGVVRKAASGPPIVAAVVADV
jgi:hypothetical protein